MVNKPMTIVIPDSTLRFAIAQPFQRVPPFSKKRLPTHTRCFRSFYSKVRHGDRYNFPGKLSIIGGPLFVWGNGRVA